MEERKKQLQELINIKNVNPERFSKGISYTNAMNTTFEEILKEFWNNINIGKCPHCKEH